MSNRNNHTLAQRIWRAHRNATAADMMPFERKITGERDCFFWRPDEIDARIVNIRTKGLRRPIVYFTYAPRPAFGDGGGK